MTKRKPEEVIEELRCSMASRYYDEKITEILWEAVDTIETLNKLRTEEMQETFKEEDLCAGTTKAQKHEMICRQLTAIYEAKNHDYGDSFARVRGMHPEAICIRLWDKLLRLESLMNGKTAKVDESIEDTLKDLANYAIMELVERGGQEDE